MFSNEVKIGILTVVAIGLTIWGFTFIKGKNLFSDTKIYKVVYNDVSGLTKSAPVLLSGYKVGMVNDIYLNPDNPKTVIAELDINGDVMVPKETKASLASGGLMEGMVVILESEGFCSGPDCLAEGSFLKGRKVGMVESMLGIDLDEYLDQAKGDLDGMMGDLNKRVADPNNDALAAVTLRNIQETTENLKQLTQKLDVLIGSSVGKFDAILNNMESLTGNLEKDNQKITGILDNAVTLTQNLKSLDLQKTVSGVDGTLGKVNGTLNGADDALLQLKTSLVSADEAIKDVNKLIVDLKEGEGTISTLLNDDKLVKDLESTLQTFNELGRDFDEKPYNFMPFKSRKRVLKNRKKDAEEGL